MRRSALAAVVALFAGPALAQAPMSTAGGSGAPPSTTATAPASVDPLAPAIGPPNPVAMGPCGPEKVKADGKLETKPHGEVEVGVGTGGYRHVSAVVCQPIGQTGAVTVGVSDTQFSDGRSRRR